MCNLYSHTKGQQAILEFTRAMKDLTGNLPPQPGIFPDYSAPIVRNTAEGRELAMARWGMPSSAKAIFEATQKRARGLEAKCKPVDFQALLQMEPDILRTPEEVDTWLGAPTPEALKLQRPLPDGSLQIVARGTKKDGAELLI